MPFVPKPSGVLTLQVAKPSEVVAVTPFTVTLLMPESPSKLVPDTVMVFVAVDVPDAGEVMATVGTEVSCVEDTTLLAAEAPMLFEA